MTQFNKGWGVRELRRRLREGERIHTDYILKKDGTPIMFCNKQDRAFGVHEDCPRIQWGMVFMHRNKVFTGCIGEEPCDWEGEK